MDNLLSNLVHELTHGFEEINNVGGTYHDYINEDAYRSMSQEEKIAITKDYVNACIKKEGVVRAFYYKFGILECIKNYE